VNRKRFEANDYRDPCPPISCGACPPVDELSTTRQYFVPTCYAGSCGIADLREQDATTCSSDADCVLRDGAQCCEGCDGTGIVTVNPSKLDIPSLCAEDQGCPDCASIIPPEYGAQCQSGRCRVVRAVDAGAR
jgi:hypothetical protein